MNSGSQSSTIPSCWDDHHYGETFSRRSHECGSDSLVLFLPYTAKFLLQYSDCSSRIGVATSARKAGGRYSDHHDYEDVSSLSGLKHTRKAEADVAENIPRRYKIMNLWPGPRSTISERNAETPDAGTVHVGEHRIIVRRASKIQRQISAHWATLAGRGRAASCKPQGSECNPFSELGAPRRRRATGGPEAARTPSRPQAGGGRQATSAH